MHDAHVRRAVFIQIQPLALERGAPVEAEAAFDNEGIDIFAALIEPARLERGIANGVVRALNGVEGIDRRAVRHADDEHGDEEREPAEDQENQQEGVHGELGTSHFFLLFPSLSRERFKPLCAALFEPRDHKGGEAAEEDDEEREEGRQGHFAAEQEPAAAGNDGEQPAEQEHDEDGHALLDGGNLIRPVEVGAHRAEQERDGGEQHAVEQRHDHQQRRLEQGCPQGDGGAGAAEERERRREHKLQIELCTQRLPCGHGQRLQQPQALALERDGGGRHVVHRGHQADGRAEQRREDAGLAGDHVAKQIDELPSLPEQGDGGDGHEEDAQAAVEHIVCIRDKAAQLLLQQGAGHALRADGALFVDPFRPGGAGAGGDSEEAAR